MKLLRPVIVACMLGLSVVPAHAATSTSTTKTATPPWSAVTTSGGTSDCQGSSQEPIAGEGETCAQQASASRDGSMTLSASVSKGLDPEMRIPRTGVHAFARADFTVTPPKLSQALSDAKFTARIHVDMAQVTYAGTAGSHTVRIQAGMIAPSTTAGNPEISYNGTADINAASTGTDIDVVGYGSTVAGDHYTIGPTIKPFTVWVTAVADISGLVREDICQQPPVGWGCIGPEIHKSEYDPAYTATASVALTAHLTAFSVTGPIW